MKTSAKSASKAFEHADFFDMICMLTYGIRFLLSNEGFLIQQRLKGEGSYEHQ